ncbi:hypothetical protein WJX73_006774 [Symbiochloris irregularis]|uniref:Bromo domain-containing protein n=1 Tax=Symbiochloris irregularis TaxID=706552 RepID=A0AAW1PZ41_9CHLO
MEDERVDAAAAQTQALGPPQAAAAAQPQSSLQAARQELHKLLLDVYQAMERTIPPERIGPFLDKVRKVIAPDYNNFVPRNEEMWIKKILSKIKRLEYTHSDQLCQDFITLRRNCETYNNSATAQHPSDWLIPFANEIVEVCYFEVNERFNALTAAEDKLATEIARAPAEELAQPARKPKRKRAPVLPLPPGFQRVLKHSERKPEGWVEYVGTCPPELGHTFSPRLDRVQKLAEFFDRHARCRPEWVPFARHPGEGDEAYQERLRQSWSFSKHGVWGDRNTVKQRVAGIPVPSGQPRPAQRASVSHESRQATATPRPLSYAGVPVKQEPSEVEDMPRRSLESLLSNLPSTNHLPAPHAAASHAPAAMNSPGVQHPAEAAAKRMRTDSPSLIRVSLPTISAQQPASGPSQHNSFQMLKQCRSASAQEGSQTREMLQHALGVMTELKRQAQTYEGAMQHWKTQAGREKAEKDKLQQALNSAQQSSALPLDTMTTLTNELLQMQQKKT